MHGEACRKARFQPEVPVGTAKASMDGVAAVHGTRVRHHEAGSSRIDAVQFASLGWKDLIPTG